MISIRGLDKYFNKGRQNEIHVINDISLELPERGMVAIFGRSGCGKTTLLNAIGGLDDFESGAVCVDGHDIRCDTDDVRNRYIGYIFQNYNLNASESCYSNVAAALRLCGISDPEEISSRVRAALHAVGMANYARRTPDTLSGGQQQRIAIARAIVKNPRIILADEPTGNLDEANTLMIMELLSSIARDHLVVLVTHELELVDHYCNTVVELSDGRVVSVRENKPTEGFAQRDKNDIYLGELERSVISDANAEIEYYGDALWEPLRIKIVNADGKLYLKAETEGVRVLDEFSEIRLKEGSFEAIEAKSSLAKELDMSALPPVEGKSFGKLFSFADCVRSAAQTNFRTLKKGKRGKRLLRRCMTLSAAVTVFVSALFGTSFGNMIEARGEYNHSVFYLYTPNAEASDKLIAAKDDAKTGIDAVSLSGNVYPRDELIYFYTGAFETFTQQSYDGGFTANAVFLDASLAEGKRCVAGKSSQLASNEAVITTAVADKLLETSTVGFVSEHKDLVGLAIACYVGGENLQVAGVVESDETAIYLSPISLAKYRNGTYDLSVYPSSDVGLEVADGSAVLAIRDVGSADHPKVGETVKLRGETFTVSEIKRYYQDYEAYLDGMGIKKLGEEAYFRETVRKENPGLEGTEALESAVSAARLERYFEYFDYYYAEIDAYYRELLFFDPYYIELWLYFEKGVEAGKYLLLPDGYYRATVYKDRYGRYPTKAELDEAYDSLPSFSVALEPYYKSYGDEFYSSTFGSVYVTSYFVSDADYVKVSNRLGETHPSAQNENKYYVYEDGVAYEYDNVYYSVIHSSDPERTEAWLRDNFGELEAPVGYYFALYTPDDVYSEVIAENATGIAVSLIAMGVMMTVMCICMYFIMRSSLMSRIKEVGIYRAIGVSKKNLVFRFLVESATLTLRTVFVGYLVSSVFFALAGHLSSMTAELFYYPVWLALCVLVMLVAVSLLFGIVPIMLLLRKTPSRILSKYDI